MSKKIYFCGSIHGGRQDEQLYVKIVQELKAKYGQVLTDYVASPQPGPDELKNWDDHKIHDKSLQFMEHSDVVVAEVTQPSLGVGYEIGRAVTMGKKILCLFRPDTDRSLSCMIRGLHNDKQVTVKDYKADDVNDVLEEFFRKCSD